MNGEPASLDCLLWVRNALQHLIKERVINRRSVELESALDHVCTAIGKLDETLPSDAPVEEHEIDADAVLMRCLQLPQETVHLWATLGQRQAPRVLRNPEMLLTWLRVVRNTLRYLANELQNDDAIKSALSVVSLFVGERMFLPKGNRPPLPE
jgi:hypothetical protein